MEPGRRERYRETLRVLGRAAGLSSLAVATLASGPCGPCTVYDDCASVDELLATRKVGVADPDASAGSGEAAAARAANIATANEWDGMGCPSPKQYAAIVSLKDPLRYAEGEVTVSSVVVSGKCCYHFSGDDCGQGGRPFLVKGQQRVASLLGDCMSPSTWLSDARVEHASVAAFARLSLQLLSLGAPSELVREAQLASLDELDHARFFFALASAEAESVLRPGALDIRGALDDLSLAVLIESNLLEGCIGETEAAERLRERAAGVGNAELRASLLAIADDEARHAELAFRILAWCRDRAPELTRSILQAVLKQRESRRHDDCTWQHVLSPLLGALTA